MRSSFFASSALLACAPTASAFWNVYLGSFADPYGGGSGDMAQFFTGEPNCDDVNNRPVKFASTGNVERDGWYCEGCNAGQAVDDLSITRIEFSATTDDFSAGRRVIDQQVGIVVATQNNGGDYYDMTIRPDDGGEERWVGFCSRVRGGDDYECNAGLTGSSGVHAFNCYPEQEALSLYYP